MRVRLALGVAMLMGLAGCGAAPDDGQATSSRAASSGAAPAAQAEAKPDMPHCDKQRAIAAVEHFEQSEMYLGAQGDPVEGLILMVPEDAWKTTPLEIRKIVVAEYDCAIASPNYLRGVHLRTALHGADFDTYESGDLIDARRELQRLNALQYAQEAKDKADQAAAAAPAVAASSATPAAAPGAGPDAAAPAPAPTPPSQ